MPGAPIVVAGQRLGSLCVIGREARTGIDPALVDQLTDMAGLASTLFALKDEARVRARTAAAFAQGRVAPCPDAGGGQMSVAGSGISAPGKSSATTCFAGCINCRESGTIQFEQVLNTVFANDRPGYRGKHPGEP
jgi:hypothetical protein